MSRSPISMLRHACRVLARTPLFTLTVLATLAIAIGANSTMFAAIDAILLRPLAFPGGDRLVQLRQTEAANPLPIVPARLEDWSGMTESFEARWNELVGCNQTGRRRI